MLGALSSPLNAQPAVADASGQDRGISPHVLVGVGPDERIWSTGDPQSNRRIVEIGTGRRLERRQATSSMAPLVRRFD